MTTGRVAENSDDTVSTHELNKKRDRATCIRQSPKQTSAPLNRSIAHDETMNDETKQKNKREGINKKSTASSNPNRKNPPSSPVRSSSVHGNPSYSTYLHNSVNPLGDEEAGDSESEQAGGDAPEPHEVTLVLLSGNPDVHSPHTRDDVHGQDDGSEDCELAEDVGGLLGALVHADVDLGEVVAVGAGEEADEMC